MKYASLLRSIVVHQVIKVSPPQLTLVHIGFACKSAATIIISSICSTFLEYVL
jgi:hypothetical protein